MFHPPGKASIIGGILASTCIQPKNAMAENLIGTSLGQYEIRMLLGKGGMSAVYLAYQPSMDRTVAIKVLPREFLHDDTFLIRFQQEARTIGRLEHLHILPVYDAGEHDGLPYLVMRYLPGGTLADLINSRPLGLARVVRMVRQVADALDYAHEHEIIHRDLKPSNVLLDNSGNAYLADFGIARVTEAINLTGSRVIGTPPYIAPEMVRKGEPITGSVDLYALGVITFEALTGVPPYADPDSMKVLMAHVLEPVPSIREIDPSVSPEVDATLQRCLAKTPQERFKTAGEFAHELSRVTKLYVDYEPPLPSLADTTPSQAQRAERAEPPDTQERIVLSEEAQAEVGAEIGYWEAVPAEDEDEPVGRGILGWLLIPGVLIALAAGLAFTALTLTDGKPASLLAVLTPPSALGSVPTITATGGPPPTSMPTSTPEVEPVTLPPPSGGARLAFASNRDGDYEIYLLDIDGSNLTQLTSNVANDFDPAWSPDGTQIVYASQTDGDAEIKIMNADGSGIRQLTDNSVSDADPDWSPDGQWIAFSSNRDGDFEIYVMSVDGERVSQLTFNDHDDLTPRWSPDGLRIGYHSRSPDDYESNDIYIIDVDGGAPYRLTENSVADQWITWAPDGLRVAYTSEDELGEGRRAIFVMDLLSNQPYRLTSGAVHDDDAAWEPDGERIAFDSNRDGDSFYDLFVYNIETDELVQLTFEAANDVAPAWQP
jgi:serine/threonine protein kinase/Tol biopolymer transport system component